MSTAQYVLKNGAPIDAVKDSGIKFLLKRNLDHLEELVWGTERDETSTTGKSNRKDFYVDFFPFFNRHFPSRASLGYFRVFFSSIFFKT